MLSFIKTMGKILVRAVDSGNIQRSPTFQAIFNYYYSEAADPRQSIIFDSAGIDVNKILENRTPAIKKLSILDAGLYYDLIDGKEKTLTQELIKAWSDKKEEEIPGPQKEIITEIYALNKTKVHTIQMKFRNEALLEAGIPEKFLPGMRISFRDHEDLKLILPVERTIVDKIHNAYQILGNDIVKPKIILYGDMVGIEPLPDELKGGLETARRQVDYFMSTCDKVMEKILDITMPGSY